MRTICSATLMLAVLLLGAASGFSSPLGEIRLDRPAGWVLAGDSTVYPLQFVHEDGDAEFLVFRTDLAADEAVSSRDELKTAVSRIVDSVIMTLPKARLISSTGYDESDRLQFALEFLSATAGDSLPLRHRLVGYLYRALDGHQILFTLWAKGVDPQFADKLPEVLAMQKGFVFTGEHDSAIFGSSPRKWTLVILLTLIVIVLALYTHSRKRATDQLSRSESDWNCSCGKNNPRWVSACRECGRPRQSSMTPN